MYSFVVNPNAGSGRAAKVRSVIERYMNDAARDFVVIETAAPADAIEASRKAAMDSAAVISVGGDGTLHYVATGIIEARLAGATAALGILPAGTGNDFGRMTGIPAGVEDALGVLTRARPVAVDHGWAVWNQDGVAIRRAFINCAGIGLDAQSAILASRLKRFVGNLAYLAAPAITVVGWRSPRACVYIVGIDGEVNETWEGELILTSIANGRWIGGGIEVAPSARIDDRVLDMCLIPKLPIAKAYRLLARASKGRHANRPEVVMRKIRRVEVRTAEPLPVYVDGEPGSAAVTHATFEVAAGELPVLMPA